MTERVVDDDDDAVAAVVVVGGEFGGERVALDVAAVETERDEKTDDGELAESSVVEDAVVGRCRDGTEDVAVVCVCVF